MIARLLRGEDAVGEELVGDQEFVAAIRARARGILCARRFHLDPVDALCLHRQAAGLHDINDSIRKSSACRLLEYEFGHS